LSPAFRSPERSWGAWVLTLAAVFPGLSFAQPSPSAGAPDQLQHRLAEARALQQKGSLREAQKLYEESLDDLAARGDQDELGAALNALSQMATAQGEYGRAAASGREAIEAYRKSGNKAGERRAVNNVGLAELYRGDYPLAEARFEEALALARAGGDAEAEIEELNNLGTVFFPQARYLDALQAYRSALERVDRAGPAPWVGRRRRITLSNLATVFLRLGSYDQALEVYRELRRSPEALPPSEQARLLGNLGVLYRRLEDPHKALDTYRVAEQLFARERHRDGEIGVLKNIGIVQALDLGDLQAALGTFSKALALAEESSNRREAMQARLYRGETLLQLDKLDGASADFEAALASARELGTSEDQWKALYGLGRIDRKRGYDELAAMRFRQAISIVESVRGRLQLATLKTDFLADKRDVYDALVELLADRPDAGEIFDLLERSRSRTFQDRLRERASSGGAGPAALAAVQARLDARTLLLEYWVTPRAAAVVWATQQASGIARIPFSPQAAAELAAFTEELASGTGDRWRRASESLGRRLLSGIEPLGWPGLRHLIVVADGPLSVLPFEALQPPAATGALLVERFDVSYAPAAALLLREDRPALASWSFPWTRRLVAFGDPLVSAPPASALPVEAPRAGLATSAEEVREIARLIGGSADLHLGAASSKKRLLQGEARGVPLLHLSTHATADEANPERSRILFSPESLGGGPNYLFLREVYDLDLRGVDLTTLSACDTERGKVIRGEGLQGFSRALLSAGSRATVTTLWRVADRPTTELMKQLYFELGRGTPKAEALRLAKLQFLRSGTALRHPRFWAAFVLNGDGPHPIPYRFPWNGLLAPAALALLALAVVSGRRTRRTARWRAARPRLSA
jgi:CHAT domain-containing protein/tetratricopeptide (TPR) repeat protein